jgi:hypothetical protein
MKQTDLFDYSRTRIIPDEKHDLNLACRVGEKFKHDVEAMAAAKGIKPSEYVYECIVARYLDDYKTLLLMHNRENLTVKELLKR